MTGQALFVDLPNFYSRLLSSGIADATVLKGYFLHWFDFDRLAEKLTEEFSPVWVFYSGERIGPRSKRIQNRCLGDFVKRINSLRGVTARDVNIPGQQREPASYRCQKCGHEGTAHWESEKGIDASLTVHLFDTMGTWDVGYLLSGDADFVPAVASLCRRGKIVIGAGFPDASPALRRECYYYIDLCSDFLREDVAAYEVFREGGIVHRWVTDEVEPLSRSAKPPERVSLSFTWEPSRRPDVTEAARLLSFNESSDLEVSYSVDLWSEASIDLSKREEQISAFRQRFPEHFVEVSPPTAERFQYELRISPLSWNGVVRRLEALISSIVGLRVLPDYRSGVHPYGGYGLDYQYDSGMNRYEPIID